MKSFFITHIHGTPILETTEVFFINTIGMEVASYLSDKAASVAMIGTSRYPYEKSLGPEIGKMSMQVRNDDDSSLSTVIAQCDFICFY